MPRPYQLTAGDIEIFKRAVDPSDGIGVNWFIKYYFGGRELREWQFFWHHARQTQLSCVGGVGCVAGDTRLAGNELTIEELAKRGQPIQVISWTGHHFRLTPASAPFWKGKEQLYKVTLKSGHQIRVTAAHRFLTGAGWRRTDELIAAGGAYIACYDAGRLAYHPVESITSEPEQDFFDLHVPGWENYLAHGMIHHNSGKTVGAGLSYAAFAAMTPGYEFMSVAPTAWQSALMYRAILAEAADKPFEKFIYKYAERPYPRIILKHSGIGESTMWFMSAADDAERIQGVSLDAANIDEAGVLIDGTWLLTMLVSRLRGTVNMKNGRERPRQRRLSVITANYEVAPPWLWERMDRMFENPEFFLSMIVKSEDNLSQDDLDSFKLVIPKDQWEMMLEGKKPEGSGEHFHVSSVSACEDWSLNRHAQYHLLEKETPTPEWAYEETGGAGCTHWEMPSEARKGRMYLEIGDPGSDNPPRRNAGVVMVLDITDFPKKPATLVYFKWVYGHGTYDNFLTAYEYAYNKYRPVDALIDSTGTQKLWNEQVLLDRGIIASGMNFSGDKKGMLVAAMRLVERQMIRWPYIQGIRGQLLTYRLADDNKLPQDIVATLMMAAYFLRMYQWEDYAEEHQPEHPVTMAPAREARSQVLTPRTAGIYTCSVNENVVAGYPRAYSVDGPQFG